MAKTRIPILAAVAGLLLAAMPALAHHSFAAVYDYSKPVTLQGTVISFEFINPHGWVTMDVKNADGKVDRWRVEAGLGGSCFATEDGRYVF